ncbi:MAG: GntR family transcriptional regulator [Anaerolineales bacterium]|nr:GntR family transcriptional regulator [Anaerolineales bacterium]
MVNLIERPPTLTSAVAESIQEAIYRGELKPGDALREIELGESLQVSRTTVREALRSLQEDGLVEVFTHRGAYVTTLTPDRVRDTFSLRAQLESFAVREIMNEHGYSSQALQTLDGLLDQMSELEGEKKIRDKVKLDLDFHQSICQPSRNELLHNFLRTVHSRSKLCIISLNLHIDHPYVVSYLHNSGHHRLIFDAIRQGDPDHAYQVVEEHIIGSGKALINILESIEPETV